ncbi:coiled-coil domain-containing protein 150 [Elgaria multicarinata webbii]|uniref:coiled-coil domain-containing protein 150 n=1 Tax=Elgaria multicarinata webbii TaxID=159646 RepID=UPI002FCCC12E
MMARPIISPVSINPTAPETFIVLNQRMRVVEEQTNALLRDLRTLGVNGHSMELFPSKPLENSNDHQSISPVHARVAFIGGNDTLWRTCETLVNRMCRLESVMQTLKLNMFRLQTEKELNPKHTANLEQRLNTIQKEHMEELKVLQMEGRMLCQQLRESREEEEKARDQAQRLSAALEIATATKRDVAIAADELRATKKKLNHELQELTEQLSKESGMRKSLEQSQTVLLYQMQDMEVTVEKERQQVHILQQDCNSLHQDIQTSRERLQKEEERTVRLEQECIQLKSDLESRESTISRLGEEGKAAQLSLSRAKEENVQLRSEINALREVAEKVQVLNEQLTQQCAELGGTVRSATMENAQLISDHQAALKVEQDKINQKLQEQDSILDAARASITGELQIVQNEKAQLQREMEALRAEHTDCKQKSCKVKGTTTTQTELLGSTVARIQKDMETAVQERETLLKEKAKLEEEMQKTIHEVMQENKRLDAELTENKLEIGPLKDTLKMLEEENKKLMEREAASEHQQHAQQQVKQVLEELSDNKNKMAYDKGKLQTRVQQLEEELQSHVDVRSENSQLRKLNTALETKYNQMNVDLGSIRINMQRMEAQLKQAANAVATMPLKKRKSSESCWQQKPNDRFRSCLACDVKSNLGLGERASNMYFPTRRVRFATDLPGRESASDCGDSLRASPRTLFRSMKAMEEELESKRESLSFELLDTEWDVASEGTDLQRSQSALVCKEEDYSVTVKARDKALRENQKLKGQISATQEREKHKLANLRRKLEESKDDNVKMTTMLENVLASHNKMQIALEEVQTELGHKDSEIAGLKKDRAQSQQRIQKLEAELEHWHGKLVLEPQHSVKMDPLRKALEVSKVDNKKLAQNLEHTLQTNKALQSKLMLVQDELDSKEDEYQQLMECRDQLIEETKMEAKLYADRLETLKKQFQTEREVTKKAAQKESAELKKVLEEACSKSGEMSRHNRELRAKVMELEAALASQKEKVKKQRVLITQYFNSKTNNARNSERIKEIESELRQMEELKEQYQKKNYEQSLSIKEFVTELTNLQSEMQQLAKNQQAMAAENKNLESQLKVEQKRRQQLEEACQDLQDTIRHLKKCKDDTEHKLKEAGKESEQITANLEEAHHWFKSKFDSLQRELAKNRKQKNPAEHNCEEEESPVNHPSQACLKRWETKNHLKFISRKYLNELNKR